MKSLTSTALPLVTLLLGATAFLAGCTVEDGNDSSEEEAKEITITDDYTSTTVSSGALYDLIVSGSGKNLSVEDNVNKITITGDDNVLTLQDDTLISKITISGDSNIVQAEADYSYHIDSILTTGSNNLIVTGTYSSWTDTQSGNASEANNVTGSVKN